MGQNKELAENILDAVGGNQNIKSVTHCMTRLRFSLVDESIIDDETIKQIDGVMGILRNKEEYQVIIGTNVPKVYDELCRIANFKEVSPIDKNSDGKKEKLTLKKIGNSTIDYMAKSMIPMIPILISAGLCKSVNAIFGPTILNLYSETSNFYVFLDFMFNAGFYFMPIFVGISAAKQLNITSFLGGYLGAVLISPGMVSLVNEKKSFDILGLPVALNDYSQTVFPIMISVFFMSLVYKMVKRIVPDVLSTLFIPFLTILITTPIVLSLLAPLGSIVGNSIGDGLLLFSEKTGFLGVGVLAAIWQFLVMTGMHVALIVPMFSTFFETGQASGAAIAAGFSIWSCIGVALGASLKIKNKKKKGVALGALTSGILGGVTEPTLYGICLPYRRCFAGVALGGFVGGAYSAITHATQFTLPTNHFLYLISFTGGTTANLVNGIVSCIISFIVAAIVTYLFGFSNEDLKQISQ